MVAQYISNFILSCIPGFGWLIFMLAIHIVVSSLAHIFFEKDFSFMEWPKCLKMWILFMTGIIAVNAGVNVSSELAGSQFIYPSMIGLQALVYTMYLGYYLDNIFKHLNVMGIPIPPGLSEAIKALFDKVKSFTL